MLDIQKYLRANNSLDSLTTAYSIKSKRHNTFNNLVLLKYDQINSPFNEEIVRECRGIILDENNNWNVVSRAFNKFFNYAEGNAAEIDWATARVQEKADGSLCSFYHYAGAWHVATSGTPDASGNLHLTDRSFASMFWQVYGDENEPPNKDYTFYFELTSPYNRIVVIHREAKLTLLGARHVSSGQEVSVSDANRLLGRPDHINTIKEFPLNNIKDILDSFESINPLAQEGYVVVDGNFNRIKIKHPGYVVLHHAKDGLSTRAFVEIARNGEVAEVLVAFPEFKHLLDDADNRLKKLTSEVNTDYERLKHIPEQKAFAFEAVKTKCSAALFQVRAKKVSSPREYFSKIPIDSLMSLLGYKNNIPVNAESIIVT